MILLLVKKKLYLGGLQLELSHFILNASLTTQKGPFVGFVNPLNPRLFFSSALSNSSKTIRSQHKQFLAPLITSA